MKKKNYATEENSSLGLAAFEFWECVWISRRVNRVADFISKMGRVMPSQGLVSRWQGSELSCVK